MLSVLALLPMIASLPMEHDTTVLDIHNLPKVGVYRARGNRDHAVWVIRRNNVVFDLTGRSLIAERGSQESQGDAEGVGILLEGCSNVTLKNVAVSGFRYNILAKNCTNLRILGGKVNGSRAIRIADGGKPIEQFLNLRNLSAWRSYGAGIWLEKCAKAEVRGCTAQFAQNGIVLVDSTTTLVTENQCSYNSGWGIAFWNTNNSAVVWNHADFCNRPWAGGWGGDAAGLVAVNNCHKNIFIDNSLTHGGDGFFLTDLVNGGYNPQTKKYSFSGTSDHNLVAYNDGSWSSHNSFEGTFAEGTIYLRNQADDSNYGFWLGFSSHTMIVQNDVKRDTGDGIAINQGAINTIYRNDIDQVGGIGIHVWSGQGPVQEDQPSDQNDISENRIVNCKVAINLDLSTNYSVLSNTIENAPLSKAIKAGFATFMQSQLLAGWLQHKDVKLAEGWHARRPKGWEYYRGSSGPKGPEAIHLGDFSPLPKD